MNLKYVILACLLSAIVSAVFTQYYFPKVTTKVVETTKEVVKTDVQTIVHTVTQPNGAVDSTTTITDHSQKVDTSKNVAILTITKDWLVSASYSTSIHDLEPIYGIQVSRRILGPVYIGALLNTKSQIGLSVGLEF